ncbi:MAG: hypothetical protein E7388_07515 [Ruminococcaceae bacterium]|nr:hypothetical protein [Oscillospiraceae bacterium]
MSFRDIIGQENVKEILREAVTTGRVGHAYMFLGSDGIGKLTVAKSFAEMIMCADMGANGESCGVCKACLMNKNGSNPDIRIIDIPEKKTSIGVEPIREMQEDVLTAPMYSSKKVYIIRHAEALSVAAQNVLLKTLEEPPAYVVIVLLCSNISLMLDTVKSRVNRLDFARYTDDEIRQALMERMLDPGDDKVVFSYADGIVGRAISYFQDDNINEVRESLLNVVTGLYKEGAEFRINATSYVIKQKDYKEFVFFTMMSFYRDIAMVARYGKYAEVQNPKHLDILTETAGKIGYYRSVKCIELIDKTWLRIKQNTNYELAVGNMFIKLQEVLNG